MERDFRSDMQWSSSDSSTFTRVTRRHRIMRKILPCVDEDFSSSLARSGDVNEPNYPPKIITTDYRKNRSYKSRKSRRNSIDRYEKSDSLEKGDAVETARSIGSLGSSPTLVESKELEWKMAEGGHISSIYDRRMSTMSNPYGRRMSSPTLSPISPLSPCLLRGIEDDDEIYPYP